MRNRLSAIGLTVLLAASVLTVTGCESKTVSTASYYVGNWGNGSENIIYLGTDGKFELYSSIGTETGTYELSDDTLTLDSSDDGTDDYSYKTVDRKYILSQKFTGTVSDGDTFRGTFVCEQGNGGEKLEFYENGNMSYEIYITNMSDNRIPGNYTREGNIIRCDCTLYGERDYIIVDGSLYSFYELDSDYTPTATPTPTGAAETETATVTESNDGTETETETTAEEATAAAEATETAAEETGTETTAAKTAE